MSKFFGFGDGYYDPPDEPETTLAEDLANAIDALLAYCEQHPTIRETLNSHFAALREIRDEMKQADDAENTAQYEAETALDKEMQEAFETNQARLHDDDGDWQERHDGPTSGEEF